MSLSIQNTGSAVQQNQVAQSKGKQNVAFGVNTVIVRDSFKALLKSEAEKGDISSSVVKKILKQITQLTEGTLLEKLTGAAKRRTDTIVFSAVPRLKDSPKPDVYKMELAHKGRTISKKIFGLSEYTIPDTYKGLKDRIKDSIKIESLL